MNLNKFNARFESLNTAARKVYNATPISESWDIAQIIRELERNLSRMDYRVVHGCLSALVDNGLVIESARGEYRRTPVRERAAPATPIEVKEEPVKNVPPPAMPAAVAKLSPLDILASLAVRAKDLTADIESAALAIQEQLEATEKDMEKFRQLQAILKGLRA